MWWLLSSWAEGEKQGISRAWGIQPVLSGRKPQSPTNISLPPAVAATSSWDSCHLHTWLLPLINNLCLPLHRASLSEAFRVHYGCMSAQQRIFSTHPPTHFTKQHPRVWNRSMLHSRFFSAVRRCRSMTQPTQLFLHLYIKLSASCWEFNHSKSCQRYTRCSTEGYFLYLWTRNNWIFHVLLHIFLRNNQKARKMLPLGELHLRFTSQGKLCLRDCVIPFTLLQGLLGRTLCEHLWVW